MMFVMPGFHMNYPSLHLRNKLKKFIGNTNFHICTGRAQQIYAGKPPVFVACAPSQAEDVLVVYELKHGETISQENLDVFSANYGAKWHRSFPKCRHHGALEVWIMPAEGYFKEICEDLQETLDLHIEHADEVVAATEKAVDSMAEEAAAQFMSFLDAMLGEHSPENDDIPDFVEFSRMVH